MLVLISALALAQSGPFDRLEASYPWGDALYAEPTPDHTRLFVAAGAAISVLDVTSFPPVTTPTVIDRFEIPECAPMSMRFHELPDLIHPGPFIRRLFMAGGALGS